MRLILNFNKTILIFLFVSRGIILSAFNRSQSELLLTILAWINSLVFRVPAYYWQTKIIWRIIGCLLSNWVYLLALNTILFFEFRFCTSSLFYISLLQERFFRILCTIKSCYVLICKIIIGAFIEYFIRTLSQSDFPSLSTSIVEILLTFFPKSWRIMPGYFHRWNCCFDW